MITAKLGIRQEIRANASKYDFGFGLALLILG
jgi:hypothetical protein